MGIFGDLFKDSYKEAMEAEERRREREKLEDYEPPSGRRQRGWQEQKEPIYGSRKVHDGNHGWDYEITGYTTERVYVDEYGAVYDHEPTEREIKERHQSERKTSESPKQTEQTSEVKKTINSGASGTHLDDLIKKALERGEHSYELDAVWKSGDAAESIELFTKFLENGYTPTYGACGGYRKSLQKPEVIKLACKYGLSSEVATRLFVQTKDPEVMEILVKEGKADVSKYPMTEIQKWLDKPDTVTIERVQIGTRTIPGDINSPDPRDRFSDTFPVYKEIKHVTKNNEGALPVFRKLVELGYKPENDEDTKAFEYMTEKLKPIIEAEKKQAKLEAERKAEEQRRDAEIAKIGDDYPWGQKLLASVLIKAGIMKDSSQVDQICDTLNNEAQKQEFERLQKEGILSEKFEVLKPWEFINSEFFTNAEMLGLAYIGDLQNIPAIKSFKDEHEFELKFAEAQKAVDREIEKVRKEADRKVEENERKIKEAKQEAKKKAQQAEMKALQDRQDAEWKALKDKQEAESKPILDRQKEEEKALKDKQEAEKKAQGSDSRTLEDKQFAERQALRDKQFAERKTLRDKQYAERETLRDKQYAERETLRNKQFAERQALTSRQKIEKKAQEIGKKTQLEVLEKVEKSVLQKIYNDTKLQDIVTEIKQMDQKTVNYLAENAAKASGRLAKAQDTDKEENSEIRDFHKIKLLGVYLTLHDRSTGTAKNLLQAELLKFRIGHYSNTDRKEMLDLFQKAKKMLNGELKEDVVVKGLTRKSYTPLSSLNKALKEAKIER